MAKVLRLHNTFKRCLSPVVISAKTIGVDNNCGQLFARPRQASFYICGPTVYDECHLGHALTYIKADLLRRFMKAMFAVNLNTVMNITDVDDKIIVKSLKNPTSGATITSDPHQHPYREVGDKYYQSFLADMKSLRVLPADLYVRVSKNIGLITNFIRRLERNGHTYVDGAGDIRFRVNTVQNYIGRGDPRLVNLADQEERAMEAKNFVLWKSAKPNEPTWTYKSSTTDKIISGRPGWHVQCSAIATALFGNNLDFHYGGKDLIFPHHYNEEACCAAYHNLDTSDNIHVWARNWLHSGHLVYRDIKMSKSLGNVVKIGDFLQQYSANILRLMCINSHYRSNIDFDDAKVEKMKQLDHRLAAFGSFLVQHLRSSQDKVDCEIDNDTLFSQQLSAEVEQLVSETGSSIVNNVCDDFHLESGLEAILNMSKLIYNRNTSGNLTACDSIAILSLFKDWCATCGLEYEFLNETNADEDSTLSLLVNFRENVRRTALNHSKVGKDKTSCDVEQVSKTLLVECDRVRDKLKELKFVLRDEKL